MKNNIYPLVLASLIGRAEATINVAAEKAPNSYGGIVELEHLFSDGDLSPFFSAELEGSTSKALGGSWEFGLRYDLGDVAIYGSLGVPLNPFYESGSYTTGLGGEYSVNEDLSIFVDWQGKHGVDGPFKLGNVYFDNPLGELNNVFRVGAKFAISGD